MSKHTLAQPLTERERELIDGMIYITLRNVITSPKPEETRNE